MYILGIETSCDETAVSVIEDNKIILSNIISSQIDVHKKYGGVVPELASRRHIENISIVLAESINSAGIKLDDIDLIAATKGPGLIGALLVGLSTAKALSYSLDTPVIGVNHIEGHILSVFFSHTPRFPFISLIASGGHTELYLVKNYCTYTLLGTTRDDAVGESFDKTAKVLGLDYPGGPAIEQMAKTGNPEAIHFPRAYLKKNSLDFSFSGVKTSVRNYTMNNNNINKHDVAASFQASVIEVIVDKLICAAKKYDVHTVAAGGGVISNTALREKICRMSKENKIQAYFPKPILSTDNAAMIALAGYYRYMHNKNRSDDPFTLDADPKMGL